MKNAKEFRYYIAYGSNLNIRQMETRCPDAQIVGTTELTGWRLMFKGSKSGNYLTIERAEGHTVPAAVWAVSEEDERNLDRYEGYPVFYYKKKFEITQLETETGRQISVVAFAYIMHEERAPGLPTETYFNRCLEGYRNFGFDPAFLIEAYNYSGKVYK